MTRGRRPRRPLRARRAVAGPAPDLTTLVGTLKFANPVMTASGTSGRADELASYVDLSTLGAVVTKSVCVGPWPGNPAPRLHQSDAGMLNSVGLQGPGVAAWVDEDLPRLVARGATVVASIWGRTVAEFAEAAALLARAEGVVAVEANVSCPNVEDRRRMFAHSPVATAEAVAAVTEAAGRPVWAKLSPNVGDIAEIAGAALGAGADAVTLVNTLLGMVVDVEGTRRPVLGAGGGGLSGAALHPVAVRAVFDCRAAHPGAAIIGAGGVSTGGDAVELLLAGADAVQVGTATFRDPRAPARVLAGLEAWCRRHRVASLKELIGAAHG